MTNRCRFTIIKYAHDPLRHEPVNVGVALWKVDDPTALVWRFDDSFRRVERLYPSASTRAVKIALTAFRDSAALDPDTLNNGYGGSGSILITEPRATRCEDLDVEVEDLFETYIEPAEEDSEEPRVEHRSSRFVKGRMNEFFKRLGVLKRLQNDQEAQRLRIVQCKSGVKHAFDYAYRNGVVHRIDAVSFDYGTSMEKIARARSFANLAEDVLNSSDGQNTVIEAVIQAPTEPLEPDVYDQAKKILGTVTLNQTEVFTDEDLRGIALKRVRSCTLHHDVP